MSLSPPSSSSAIPERVRRRLRQVSLLLGLLLFSCLCAAFAVTEFGAQTFDWQGLDVQVSLHPAWHGQTRVVLTPLGEVRAATHSTPVVLQVELRAISLKRVQTLALHPPPMAALERDFRRTARHDLRGFAVRQIVLGTLGGLVAPLFLRLRRARYWLVSAGCGGGLIALLLFITLRTFNAQAFDSPTYTGSLRQAPIIVALARNVFLRVGAFSDKLRTVATNLNALYGRLDAAVGPSPEDAHTLHILHISDIHNNAPAIGFVRDLANEFHVNAVIDTGDLTDYGLPVETTLTKGLARLPVPYLFVAGNHDSQATVRAVRAFPNAVILNGQRVNLFGLTVLGLPDPSSARAGAGSVDTSPAAIQDEASRLLADVRQTKTPPDIVCVHNPRSADQVLGQVPLVLCGHLHRAYIETDKGTVVCNAGTTGGAGTRYLVRRNGVPLMAALLTFSLPPHPHLLAIDSISLNGDLTDYSITRRSFGPPAIPAAATH